MNESELFDALRSRGIDADDPQIREAVRVVLAHVDGVRDRDGAPASRRCMEAIRVALGYELQHPDVGDMSSFEADWDEEE